MAKFFYRLALLGIFIAGGFHLRRHFIDYPVYERAALKILNGESASLYDPLRTGPGGYYYSYLFALCFTPFAKLGPWAGRIAFYGLLVGTYLKVLRFSIRQAEIPTGKNRYLVALGTVLLTVYAVNDAFINANVALPLLGLCIYAYELRERRPGLAGLALAVAIVFKIYPAFVLGYFVWDRRWKMVACTVPATILLYLAPPILFAGFAGGRQILADHRFVVSHFGQHWSYDSLVFQNVPATALRYATWLGLHSDFVFQLAIGVSLLATVAFYFPSFWASLSSDAKPLPAEYRRQMFILTLALVPVLVPVSWYNMALFYAPLISFLLGRAFFRGDRGAGVALGIYTLLFCLTTPDLVGRALNDRLEFFAVPFWGAVALFVPLVRELRAKNLTSRGAT